MASNIICAVFCAFTFFVNAWNVDIYLPKTGEQSALRHSEYTPQIGDIIFQSSPHNDLSDAIEIASKSRFSHCGIALFKNNKWYIIEAIGPVKETPLEEWIDRGRERRFTVYRLKPQYRPRIPEFISSAQSFIGRPYDFRYQFDDEKIYCSELVFKSFKKVSKEELGTVRSLGELNWRPIEAFIRKIENGSLPLAREMITPYDLSQATQLELVGEFQ